MLTNVLSEEIQEGHEICFKRIRQLSNVIADQTPWGYMVKR